jgi:hypothetical protein
MDAKTHVVQYVQDLSAIAAALFGTLGAVYGVYALYRDRVRRLTAAATTAAAGALIAGVTIAVPALDVTLSPVHGIVSLIVGVVVWEAYGFFLFVLKVAPDLERLDDPRIDTSIPHWRRSQLQPAEMAAKVWLWVAWVGGAGWAEIAVSISPQRDHLLGYTLLTVALGWLGGLAFGLFSQNPTARPAVFSFAPLATFVGVAMVLFCFVALCVTLVWSYLTGVRLGALIPPQLAPLIYVVVTPAPVVVVGLGLAPFARWKMNQLSEKQYGGIGIVLVLVAFLMQLVQPAIDLWGLVLP